MSIKYRQFLCFTRRIVHPLNKIKGVKALLKGTKSGGVSTLRYVLIFYMETGEHYKVMKSKNEQRIKKQLLTLRKFLEIELDKPIEVVDYSLQEHQKKTFGKKVVEKMKELKKPIVTAKPIVKEKDEKEKEPLI